MNKQLEMVERQPRPGTSIVVTQTTGAYLPQKGVKLPNAAIRRCHLRNRPAELPIYQSRVSLPLFTYEIVFSSPQ